VVYFSQVNPEKPESYVKVMFTEICEIRVPEFIVGKLTPFIQVFKPEGDESGINFNPSDDEESLLRNVGVYTNAPEGKTVSHRILCKSLQVRQATH